MPSTPQAKQQLAAFFAKYSPEVAAVARAAVAKMERRLPSATRLVYDNYNALAIGFCPAARASDCVLSIAVFPRWVSVFFFDGIELEDPERLLKGSGRRIRHIVLGSANDLDLPAVKALVDQAVKRAEPPFLRTGKGALVIRSISAKQRPRRPTSASSQRR